MVRISKIEIIGKNLMNRNSKLRNKPMVPMNIEKSQKVGLYIAHDDGKKSRCGLVTKIRKRGSHIPMLTMSDTTNSKGTLCLALFAQSTCGIRILQVLWAK